MFSFILILNNVVTNKTRAINYVSLESTNLHLSIIIHMETSMTFAVGAALVEARTP